VAARPWRCQLTVGSFQVSVTDQREETDGDERTFTFQVLCSDPETYDEVCESPQDYIGDIAEERIAATFGEDRYSMQGYPEPTGDTETDPRKFPRRIHAIVSCEGTGDIDDDDRGQTGLVTSLYGYKVSKWGRQDIHEDSASEDEEEDEEEASDAASDNEASGEEYKSGDEDDGGDEDEGDEDEGDEDESNSKRKRKRARKE